MTDLGTITKSYTVRYERTSRHSAERLWRAITDPAEVTKWMQYPARIDLRVGGAYYVDYAKTNEGCLDGIIVAIEPARLLRYAWGTTIVEWSIESLESGCAHTFSQFGLPDRGPGEEGLVAGWHAWLDDIEKYLDGLALLDDRSDWSKLCKRYFPVLAETFGWPEAAKG
ncbi:MAG: SRPBCC domain-containing protein [Dehalococcoidia bacterium]